MATSLMWNDWSICAELTGRRSEMERQRERIRSKVAHQISFNEALGMNHILKVSSKCVEKFDVFP